MSEGLPPIICLDCSYFTDGALDVIFKFSGGISRKVNNICLACLLDAAIRQKRPIDDRMVKVVIANEFSVKPDQRL